MKLRLAILFAALLGLAVFAGGCGGGNDSSSSESELTTSSLSKAAYVKKVNSICAKAGNDILEEMRNFADEPAGATATEAILKLWPPSLRDQAKAVRAVGVPSGDAANVEAYLGALEKSAKEIEAKEPPDIFALQRLLEPAGPPAEAAGIEGCEF